MDKILTEFGGVDFQTGAAEGAAVTEYINTATGTIHNETELRRLFCKDTDGADPTNILTFAEWLNGYHAEFDRNGRPFKCEYRRLTSK